MIHRPSGMGLFEFVVIASLRAKQLTHGCIPRVDVGHKASVTAQLEVAQGKVAAMAIAVPSPLVPLA